MAFFVNYRASGGQLFFVELETESDVVALIEGQASNPDFEFEVVEGQLTTRFAHWRRNGPVPAFGK